MSFVGDTEKIESQIVFQCAAETIQECFRNYRACLHDKMLKHELESLKQVPLYAAHLISCFFIR